MEYLDFLKDHKSIPGNLYRSFEKQEHMDDFLSGNIRLGHYCYYFNRPKENWSWEEYIADPSLVKKSSRSNKHEGNIRNIQEIQADGSLKSLIAFSFGSPHYSLSFSTEPLKDYGNFTLELNNPLEFHERVKNFLNSGLGHYAGKMVYCNNLKIGLLVFR